MSGIRMECQTYTWQMSYEKYAGKIPHMLNVIKESGYEGIEPEVCMLGEYYENPGLFADELQKRDLTLAAICLALPWSGSVETEEERQEADKLIQYLKFFPGTLLVLGQFPGKDRSNLVERQRNAISCVNEISRRANDKGIVCAYHPNSPAGSVFRIEEDYKVLIDGLDHSVIGFAPDAGHIAKGGMDVLEIFKTYRPLIRHIHFKDISQDGKWAAMGEGIIDFPEIVKFMNDTGYNGWIAVEEESEAAEVEPDAAVMKNGLYIRSKLNPISK